MLRCIYDSDTEVRITNNIDINFVQDRNPNTGELFSSREDTEAWVLEYSKQTNQEIVDSLSYAKSIKKDEISNKCKVVLYGGFESDAYQGILKRYRSTADDQSTITSLFMIALSNKLIQSSDNRQLYWHAEGEDFSEWSIDEILKLGNDLSKFEEAILFKCKKIKKYIDSLNDENEVNSISWDIELSEEFA